MTSGSGSTTSGEGRPAERVLVGRVGAAHGLRGEVAVRLESDVPQRFAPGSEVWAEPLGGAPRRLRIAASRPFRKALLVRFEQIEDREAAQQLRGAPLEVDAAEVPPPPAGGVYHFQLLGCRCADRRYGELGVVEEVVEDGGGVVLRVVGGGREVLLPFVDPYLAEVDVDQGRITWVLPEGLIEACGSESSPSSQSSSHRSSRRA
ncbi:MAG TPA: ribosome maturation factor RimM [Thermoanaerobaculia bacterium]|nr:ribosome maturation factor RimM [Thermoanaerobaculia bacterium]